MNLSLIKFFCGFLVLKLLLLTAGCSEASTTEPEDIPGELLNYDGVNITAPVLTAGRYEGAARFPASRMSGFAGRELIQVRFYTVQRPNQCTVKIYGRLNNQNPGDLLYSAPVSTSENSWNVHNLPTPLPLTGEEIWISIELVLSSNLATLGCDPGPAVTNGDWLYDNSDSDWIPLSQRTTIDINWNIRGVVSEN